MRDLGIDPEFEVPTDFSKESVDRTADDLMLGAVDWLWDYMTDTDSCNRVHRIICECLNTLAEQNRHINGQVYILDWDVFDADLRLMVEEHLEENEI